MRGLRKYASRALGIRGKWVSPGKAAPNAKVWTDWQQERWNRSEYARDVATVTTAVSPNIPSARSRGGAAAVHYTVNGVEAPWAGDYFGKVRGTEVVR